MPDNRKITILIEDDSGTSIAVFNEVIELTIEQHTIALPPQDGFRRLHNTGIKTITVVGKTLPNAIAATGDA